MPNSYRSGTWGIDVPAPWRIEECQECVEITQPEGMGALHISAALKEDGNVSETDLRSFAGKEYPEGTELARASFGGFRGVCVSYTDWHTDTFWKKWWLAFEQTMLYVTYNCGRGDEGIELFHAEKLLTGLTLGSRNIRQGFK